MMQGLTLVLQAVLFGEAVRKVGGKRYFSLERNPEFAAVIMSLADLAGLSDIVKVVVGSSTDSIKRLHAEGTLKHIDLMFLDHYKPAYTTDLKLCEHLKLVTPGSVLAADNVIKPGNPPYLEYVRSSVAKKREQYKAANTNGVDTAGFDDRWKNQYQKREGEEKLSTEVKGNPNLVYESGLVHSFEPTGVPVKISSGSPLSERSLTAIGWYRNYEMHWGGQPGTRWYRFSPNTSFITALLMETRISVDSLRNRTSLTTHEMMGQT